MKCEKHDVPFLENKGKFFCPHCLAENRRKPVKYQNLSALNVLPVGLRDCRLNNFKKTTSGKDYGFISSLRKMLDDHELNKLSFRILWINGSSKEDVSHLLASIVSERLLDRKSASYCSLSFFNTYEDAKEQLSSITLHKLCCIDYFIDSLHSVSFYQSVFHLLFSEALINNKVIVMGSHLSIEQFLNKIPQLKSIFSQHQHLIKEMRVYGK